MAAGQTAGVSLGPVREFTYVLVQVGGQYDGKPNPACAEQPPNWPCIFNAPASDFYDLAPYTTGPVQAWVVAGGSLSSIPLRGSGGALNTPGQAIGLYYAEAAGDLRVRASVNNFVSQNPNPEGGVTSWIISGAYSVSAVEIDPLTFTGGPTGDADGTVTFSVAATTPLKFINPDGVSPAAPPGDPSWYFVPGESVPLQYGSGAAYPIDACFRQTTCTYTPPTDVNGRMQVVAYVENRIVIGRSDYVRAKPSSKLELRCAPNLVKRNDDVLCEVSARPGGLLTVTKWWFDDGHGHIVRPSDPQEDSAFYWGGPVVVSGTVHVEGKIDNEGVSSDSVFITVEPRTWSFSYPAEPSLTFDRDSLPYPPVTQYGQTIGDGVLGRFYSGQFDWVFVTIGSGPNEGVTFVKNPPMVTSRLLILINAGLQADDPWYKAQIGPTSARPNGCSRAFVAREAAHVPLHESGHYKIAQQFWEAAETVAQMESPISFRDSTAAAINARIDSLDAALQTRQDQHDAHDYGIQDCDPYPLPRR